MAELEERYGRAVVRLNRNEDLFPPLAGVREAVEAELANLWMYPEESYSDFRATVADWVGTTPDRIVPAHGTQALIGTLAGLFLDPGDAVVVPRPTTASPDRKSTRLNSSHEWISYAVFCLKKKKK